MENAQFCSSCGKVISVQNNGKQKNNLNIILIAVFVIVVIAVIVVLTLVGVFSDSNNEIGIDELGKLQLDKMNGGSQTVEPVSSDISETVPEVIPEEIPAQTVQPAEIPETEPPSSLLTPPPPLTPPSAVNFSADYLYPTDKMLITYEFLSRCTSDEIRFIRNEIYARHGRPFKDEKLSSHFLSKAWYRPVAAFDDNDESILSHVERENIRIITSYESGNLQPSRKNQHLIGYENDYFAPIEPDNRSWMGYRLSIYEITDEYILFDYQYDKSGHAVVYTAQKAYFTAGNIASANGTYAYADTPANTIPVQYDFVFTNNNINLKIYNINEPSLMNDINYASLGVVR